MNLTEVLASTRRIFLDSAPIIYFVEGNPQFRPRVAPFFHAIASGSHLGITSTIALAECLVYPYRLQNNDLIQRFRAVIAEGKHTRHVGVDELCEPAAALRARYNLSLGDALQVAAAYAAGCDGFLTNDGQLKRVTELRVLVLSELTVDLHL